MATDAATDHFERIYATDLVYAPDCWKLCGDAHCCNFSRYKSQFTMIGQRHRQELPLLPGEYEFLRRKNWLKDFEPFEHRIIEYPLETGTMKLEFIVGREKMCACQHATRTTTCRLYPLLPIYDVAGSIVGVDTKFGIFEEIEQLAGMQRACKIESLPLPELGKFLTIVSAIGRDPKAVFYVMAYRLAVKHAAEQLRQPLAKQPAAAMRLLQGTFLLKRLFDQSILRPQLESLAAQFREHHGDRFQLD